MNECFFSFAVLTGVILGQGNGAKAKKKKKKKTALHDSEYVGLKSEDQVTDRSYDGAKSVNFYQGIPG